MSRLAPILLGCIGIVVLGTSLWNVSTTLAFIGRATPADGTVVSAGPGRRHPLVRFSVQSGATVEFAQGGLLRQVEDGQSVRLLYETGNPRASARIDGVDALWFVSAVTGLVGMGFLAAAWQAARAI